MMIHSPARFVQVLLLLVAVPLRAYCDERYLLYDVSPTEGFNLRRDVYMRVARIARHMGWTLVLPPWGPLPHWKGPTGLPWSLFFDVASLNNYTKVIEFNDFMDRYVGDVLLDQVYVLRHAPLKDDLDDSFYEVECSRNIGYRPVDGHLFEGDFFGRDEIKAKRVTCLEVSGTGSVLTPLIDTADDSIVMFDHAEVILHDGFGDKEYWQVRRSMAFARELRDEADKFVKRRFGDEKYLAVHLRRSDFPIVRPNDVPSIRGAAQQVSEMMRRRGLTKVFLATDGDRKEVEEFLRLVPEAVVYHVAGVRFENSENLIENSSHDLCDNPDASSGVAIPGREAKQCSSNRGDLDKPCRPLDEDHCATVDDRREERVKALPMEEKRLPVGGNCLNENQDRNLSTEEGRLRPSCGEPANPVDKPCLLKEPSCATTSTRSDDAGGDRIAVQDRVLKTSHEKCDNPHQDRRVKPPPAAAQFEPKCSTSSRSLDQPCGGGETCSQVPEHEGEPQLSGKADSKAMQKGARKPGSSCPGNDGTEIDMGCSDDTCSSMDGGRAGDFIEGACKPAPPSRLTEGQIAIVDQIICSRAEVFVGSFESTFSFRIQEEREIFGMAPDTTFNRLCADGDAGCQQPTRWTIVN